MRILVVRFRQMGDAILTTVVMNSLKASFPDCTIDFVLNEKICPLFNGHPSIDNIIPFSDSVRSNTFKYIRKVWQTVHRTHYDVIIDMRSTLNTMLFALFSPETKYRIGLKKSYTRPAFNYFVNPCQEDENMIDHNLAMLKPLEALAKIKYDREFSLSITQAEEEKFKTFLLEKGISFDKPILLVGVTAKLARKTWPENRMIETIRRVMNAFPDCQLIFNYAPGQEELNARRIYMELGKPAQVFINVQAKSQRELVAMSSLITFYFGNEGGARHIVHACGKPSFVICSPESSKQTWLPQNEVLAEGIAASDVTDTTGLSAEQQYDAIRVDDVWVRLYPILSNFL